MTEKMDSETVAQTRKRRELARLYNKHNLIAVGANTGLDIDDAIVAIKHLSPHLSKKQSFEEAKAETLAKYRLAKD